MKEMRSNQPTVTPPKPGEDPVLLKREMDALKQVHDALMTIAPERRGPVLKAVAIILQIYIPSE